MGEREYVHDSMSSKPRAAAYRLADGGSRRSSGQRSTAQIVWLLMPSILATCFCVSPLSFLVRNQKSQEETRNSV
jgi:hypothetical protein